ncbi:MAG: hypothetical protein ACJ74Z_13825 [Bryobacteraceae bacterium]|jgi:hypothetical protein
MRCFRLAQAAFAAPLVLPLLMTGDSGNPNFTGAWQMNSAKSQVVDGRLVTLTIENVSNKLKLVRVVRDKDGKEVTSQFVCGTGGTECEYDEGGHKAKVSVWYNGPALVVLKTDGLKEDASDEWTMKLSPDTHTLTVALEHIDPTSKEETLVFSKQGSH